MSPSPSTRKPALLPPDRRLLVLVPILLLTVAVFVFDIVTPPDDVSICFIYAVLIAGTIFSYRRAAYFCAAIASALSILGAFIQVPPDALSMVFFANRAIAVATQWLVAYLVTLRHDAEVRMREDYDSERAKAETGRRFLDVLSHEIGTSLTTIDGQAFRARQLAAKGEPDDIVTRCDKIRLAVRHIEAIVRQIQVVSEVDQGKLQFLPVPMKLERVVLDAIMDTSQGREIEADTSSLPLEMTGDPDLLHQALRNLLTNAMKYSPTDTPILVNGRSVDGFAELTITDKGTGIAPDERNRLFDPYFRGRNSRNIPGAGIGLYVVDQFVKLHGGTVEIHSTEGLGTAVTIRIPVRNATPE